METASDVYRPSHTVPALGRNTVKLDPNKVQVGDAVPPLARHGDLQLWNRYAGANYEFSGHHMDDEVAQEEGFDAAIGMGPLINGLFHTMLREWVNEEVGRVVRVGLQLRRPWLRKHIMTQSGRVIAIREEDGEKILSLEIWADDDRGERLAIGDAEVAVPL